MLHIVTFGMFYCDHNDWFLTGPIKSDYCVFMGKTGWVHRKEIEDYCDKILIMYPSLTEQKRICNKCFKILDWNISE